MKKIVNIIGTAESRRTIPGDCAGDVWYAGSAIKCDDIPAKPTTVFELHSRTVIDGIPGYIDRLNALNVPVYMQCHCDDIPASLEYPIDIIRGEFGDYFTNSVSWMIALAVLQEFEVINIYGVNMIHDSEYGYQEPSCEYFLGLARGRGIAVNIAEGSDLLKAPGLYGFDIVETKLRSIINEAIKRYNDKLTASRNEFNKAGAIINKNSGALSIIENLLTDEMTEDIKKKLKSRQDLISKSSTALEHKRDDLNITINQSLGAISAMRYLVKCGY